MSLTIALESNASSGKFFKPVSLAPDVSYAATSELTLSLIHSTFGTTGLRGGVGRGLCLSGATDGCAGGLYNNAGAEAVYALHSGPLDLRMVEGFYVNPAAPTASAPNAFDAKLGLKTKYTAGALAVLFNPSVFFAINNRTAAVANSDLVFIPLGVTYTVSPVLTAGVGTGLYTLDTSKFDKNFSIPLGVNAVYKLDAHYQVGASFTFSKLYAASALRNAMPSLAGTDFRGLHVWFTYSG